MTRAEAVALLDTVLERDFPLTRTMGVRVHDYTGDRLRLRAPLGPNTNAHGTGFAGSIYSVAALCGWCLIYIRLREAGVPASLVMTKADVAYHAPVTGDILATCDVRDDAAFTTALEDFARTGRARLVLPVRVGDVDTPSAVLTTHYVVRRPTP